MNSRLYFSLLLLIICSSSIHAGRQRSKSLRSCEGLPVRKALEVLEKRHEILELPYVEKVQKKNPQDALLQKASTEPNPHRSRSRKNRAERKKPWDMTKPSIK